MRIWLNPDTLARLSLSVTDIQNALRAQNVVNPAGQIGAEPAPAGQQLTYTVRAQGRLVEPEEFGNVIVRENPDGSSVRLKDVSRIELGALNYQQYGTFNGKPAGVIAAFQIPGFERARCRAGHSRSDDRAEEAISARPSTTKFRSTPPRRSTPASERSSRRSPRPSRSSCSSSSSSCRAGARR